MKAELSRLISRKLAANLEHLVVVIFFAFPFSQQCSYLRFAIECLYAIAYCITVVHSPANSTKHYPQKARL